MVENTIVDKIRINSSNVSIPNSRGAEHADQKWTIHFMCFKCKKMMTLTRKDILVNLQWRVCRELHLL